MWQPSATLDALKKRAKILSQIRQFFQNKNILEVETPVLGLNGTTDPNLHSFTTEAILPGEGSKTFFLQTSPEFHMKRLLSAGSGPIYQMSKVFRNEERGKFHHPEFTMLEWYRPGFDHHDLMDEVDEFLQNVLNTKTADRLSYTDVFKKYCDIDPLEASQNELKDCIAKNNITIDSNNMSKDDCLHVLLTHLIEPNLGTECPVFIYDYPKSQAALAKINGNVAERFELYIRGIECGNGFHELTDPQEQVERFQNDLQARNKQGLNKINLDNSFIGALEHGLPACAGVAIGIDRLIMLALGADKIDRIISFTE